MGVRRTCDERSGVPASSITACVKHHRQTWGGRWMGRAAHLLVGVFREHASSRSGSARWLGVVAMWNNGFGRG